MTTTIASTPNVDDASRRRVVRLSTGLLVTADHDPSVENIHLYTSDDGGSTWSTISNASSASLENEDVEIGVAVDSNDKVHVTATNSTESEIQWHRFTVSHGSASLDVTEVPENIQSRFWQSQPIITSTDTVYVLGQNWPRIMGTDYYHLILYERTGTGSWTRHGEFASGSTQHTNPSAAVDSADNIHFTWDAGGSAVHEVFDTSAASFGTRTNPTTNSKNSTSHYVDPSTDETVVAVQGTLYKGDSSGWTSDQYTTDNVGGASIGHGADGNLYVVYEDVDTGDLKQNNNTFGSFATGDAAAIESTSATETEPTVRWQQNFENDPSSDVIDVVANDSSNGNLVYTSVDASGSTATTDAGSITPASATPLTAGDTASASDGGAITASAASPVTASESASANDGGAVTASAASPITASESTSASDGGAITASAAGPLTASESTSASDGGAVTSATASPLTASETRRFSDAGAITPATASGLTAAETASASDGGAITAAAAASLAATESASASDGGAITAATAAPLTASDTASASDGGAVTAASATPLTATESAGTGTTDAGSITAVSAGPLTAAGTASASDAGSVTAAIGSPLGASETAAATDAGAITASSVSPLTATESTGTGTSDFTHTVSVTGEYDTSADATGVFDTADAVTAVALTSVGTTGVFDTDATVTGEYDVSAAVTGAFIVTAALAGEFDTDATLDGEIMNR